jgi:hypothetical protein
MSLHMCQQAGLLDHAPAVCVNLSCTRQQNLDSGIITSSADPHEAGPSTIQLAGGQSLVTYIMHALQTCPPHWRSFSC